MVGSQSNESELLAIPPIFRLAFRPLFFGGTLFSVIAICWWTHYWISPSNWQPYGGPIWWHGHEMLFGFGVAIVVGFLLTAVQAWTGVPSIKGKPLGVLAGSWLLGRLILPFGTDLPSTLVIIVDMSFLLIAAVAMAYPVLKAKQWRNFFFVPILLALAALNGMSHWAVQTDQVALWQQALHGTIMLFSLIIAILGGRVIPFFTVNRTGSKKAEPLMILEVVSIGSILILIVAGFTGFAQWPASILAPICFIAGIANAWRFSRWGVQHTLTIPLLWSLHFSYAFIPLGLLMLFLYSIGLVNNLSAVLHCFTVGAIGGMILAMISRVTLGHTGRPLEPPKLITVAYVLMLLGALVRVLLPAISPSLAMWGVGLAGFSWIFAFVIYLYFYGPMLLTTRADGRPG